MNKTTLFTISNTVLILLLIGLSGSSAFFAYQIGYLVFLPGLLFLFRGMKLPPNHFLFIAAMGILVITQNIQHTGSPMIASALLMISNILTIYLISRLVANDFSIIFRKIVVTICVISLVFWTGLQFSAEFKAILLDFANGLPQLSSDEELEIIRPGSFYHFFIFTVPIGDTLRNAGLFYEPGRFAIFICIALAINLFRKKEKIFDIEDVLYLATIISTFSTTGYYVMMLLFTAKLLTSYNKPAYFVLSIIILPVLIWYINTLDFMWEKVTTDLFMDATYSRFAAIAYHIELITQSPFIGWGDHIEELQLSPNGLSLLIVRWGLIFSAIYYYYLYKGIPIVIGTNWQSGFVKIIVFISVLFLAFSQTITVEPFYFAIMFFGLIKSKQLRTHG